MTAAEFLNAVQTDSFDVAAVEPRELGELLMECHNIMVMLANGKLAAIRTACQVMRLDPPDPTLFRDGVISFAHLEDIT